MGWEVLETMTGLRRPAPGAAVLYTNHSLVKWNHARPNVQRQRLYNLPHQHLREIERVRWVLNVVGSLQANDPSKNSPYCEGP